MKKILPPQLFFIFIILMGIINWSFSFTKYILYPFNLVGVFFLFFGILIAIVNKKLFIKKETNVNTFGDPDKLITEGFYKYSRNPMYLGFVVALLGITILFGSGISSVILLVIFVLIVDRWYIVFEENLMLKHFGKEYIKYCEDTRKWI